MRLTQHDARVGYPTPLDSAMLLYTAMTADSTAASLYALDLTTLATRRVNTGVEEYPTVASSSGTSRKTLVATVSNPKGALFTVPIYRRRRAGVSGATVRVAGRTRRVASLRARLRALSFVAPRAA